MSGLGGSVSGLGESVDAGARMIDRGVRSVFGDKVADLAWFEGPAWMNPANVLRDAARPVKDLGKSIAPPAERQNLATDIVGGLGQIAGQIAMALTAGPGAAGVVMFSQGADQQAERVDAAGQEVVEGVMHNVITRTLVDPSQQIFEDLSREAMAAGGAGAIARAIVNLAVRGRAHHQSGQDAQQLEQAAQAAEESKLRQRAPEAYHDFVEQAAERAGVDTIYVNGEALAQYFQSIAVDPRTLISGMPYLDLPGKSGEQRC
ncbi:hypothetical protein [Magnetospirillum sulfuroxidans]|uniref:Uncharacterized protein n=1 Tax=Magnetospirillum sulfuroxidans TaxID=611300 RepID=A0ABS5IE71_9PROT|nr:hypothetical protein [Magnetospirillum sulfuroxidans]MBR9972038.1 hypothetical protein [Magnetospirillum sulfuroxidans]